MNKMNKANKLTIIRLILIIPFLIFLSLSYMRAFSYVPGINFIKGFARLISIVIFLAAVYTDYLDGKIARENDMVTDFGKIMDPIADKLLTFTLLLVLVSVNALPVFILLILLAREFLVTAERALVAAKGGKIIPASNYGKLKTLSLYIALTVILFIPNYKWVTLTINTILLLPAIVLSILSAIEYHKEAKEYINTEI